MTCLSSQEHGPGHLDQAKLTDHRRRASARHWIPDGLQLSSDWSSSFSQWNSSWCLVASALNAEPYARNMNITQVLFVQLMFCTYSWRKRPNLQVVSSWLLLNVPAIKSGYSCVTLVFHVVAHPGWLAVQFSTIESFYVATLMNFYLWQQMYNGSVWYLLLCSL